MPDLRPIFHIIGLLLTGFAILMFVPAIYDLALGNDDWFVFWASAMTTGFFGLAMVLANRRPRSGLTLKQAFLLTTLAWVAMGLFGALPFRFAGVSLGYAGSFFEAISGLTTTGATVLSGLDRMPPGILLWRGMLHLIGGYGIIVMAIAIMPFLGSGGMQLLKTESSSTAMENVLPRAREIVVATGGIYIALNLLCTVGFLAGGMELFDASVHAMSAVATGGFSTSDLGLSHPQWDNEIVHWNAVVFMLAGALPFTLYMKTIKGSWTALAKDEQVRLLLVIVFTAALILTLWLTIENGVGLWDAIRHSVFNVVSVVTTTGIMSMDYNQWGVLPLVVFAMLIVVGGCTGSTAGGIKMMRFIVLAGAVRKYTHQVVTPHGVFQSRFNGLPIPEEVTGSVTAFFVVFAACAAVLMLLVAATGVDAMTAFTGVLTCMANTGPGLGPLIGPAGNFEPLSDSAKWLLSFAMILGRLELFTVLVLFTRHFWRA